MIDTDKYEGHTPAPWKFTDFDPLHLWGESPIISGGEGYSQNEADWKLIADAPDLLAEVNRHRPPRVDGKYMAWSDSHPRHGRTSWIVEVMEGITDVGYWTWVNWQLQYGEGDEE